MTALFVLAAIVFWGIFAWCIRPTNRLGEGGTFLAGFSLITADHFTATALKNLTGIPYDTTLMVIILAAITLMGIAIFRAQWRLSRRAPTDSSDT